MSDRKLLELAAKAAGYLGYQDGCAIVGERGQSITWNPLTDDGDALRLAVACDMTVCADGLATVSACSGYGRDRVMVTQTVSESGGDKNAATRRAIVRTGAEIGKRMTAQEGDP
jgi:hypothetical protein